MISRCRPFFGALNVGVGLVALVLLLSVRFDVGGQRIVLVPMIPALSNPGQSNPHQDRNFRPTSSCNSCHSLRDTEPFSLGREDVKEAGPKQRALWFWQQRTYPRGDVPNEIHVAAVETELLQPQVSALAGESPVWQELGPAPVKGIVYGGDTRQDSSGRTLAVALHPGNANVVLAGTAQGGIWRSSDGAASFQSVSELVLPSLAIKVIRFAPSDPHIVYAGTGEPHGSDTLYGMGVVKSTDAGQTWQALPRKGSSWNFEYASVSGLQVDPRNANVLYVTTALINPVPDPFLPPNNSKPQTGIFKSTDGGQTWQLLKAATEYAPSLSHLKGNVGFMDLESGGSQSPDLLYATEYQGGIYKSTDGGATWNRVTPMKSSTGAKLPVAVSSYAYFDNAGGENSSFRFYNLTRLELQDQYPDFTRIEIGVARSNPNVVYAGYAVPDLYVSPGAGQNPLPVEAGLLFKTTNGGQSWTYLGDWLKGVPNYCGSQCDYDNMIEVNPSDPNDLVIGGNANYDMIWPDPIANPNRLNVLPWRGMVYRSRDGGSTWIDTSMHYAGIKSENSGSYGNPPLPVYEWTTADPTRATHPDIHSAAFAPDGRIYVASDGGLYRLLTSGGGTQSTDYRWENLNRGLATLQFYYFDVHPTDPNLILGGMQDNGAAYYNGSFWDGWGSGDGTLGLFDPVEPKYVYLGSQNKVSRHDNGGVKEWGPNAGWKVGIFDTTKVAKGERVQFVPIFAIDPVDTKILYGGGDARTSEGNAVGGLYRSTDRGDNWSRVGSIDSFKMDGFVGSIAVSPANHNLVWVGTSTGKVYLFDFTSSTNNQRATGMPNRWVTRVVPSPTSADTVYAVFSGYDANTPSTPGKVFKSTNRGQSWTGISGGLPDVPFSALAVDPKNEARMWAGSDVGVYATTDGGASWTSYRGNMPVVLITDLKYNSRTGYLTVATHGRGAWRINPDVPIPPGGGGGGGGGTGGTLLKGYLPIVFKKSDGKGSTPGPVAPTATPSTTPQPTATSTWTPVPPSATSTWTPTPTWTWTPTWTSTPTRTPTPTSTWTPTRTSTPTSTSTRTPTATGTSTPTVTGTPPTATSTPTASSTATATVTPGPGISGEVKAAGTPVTGVALALNRCDTATRSVCSTTATTTTGSGGRYSFTGAATLPVGQFYVVTYSNGSGGNALDSTRLWYWQSHDIIAYTSGAGAAGGDFDIADVVMVSPAHGASVPLPTTFTWTGRGVANDQYALGVDSQLGSQLCYSTLSNSSSFNFTTTFGSSCGGGGGLSYSTTYRWYVWVANGATWTNGYGLSYYYRNVSFSPGGG